MDDMLWRIVLKGDSCRQYKSCELNDNYCGGFGG